MIRNMGKRRKDKLLSVRVPETLLPWLDQGVKREDSDRSKFIRTAILEKLARQSVMER